MFIIFIEGWTDLEVTHLIRYHQRRVVHLPQSLSVRVAPARRCNNVSKLLEYLLRLPYPAPYEGTLTCALSKEKKSILVRYIFEEISSNINTWYKNIERLIECLHLVDSYSKYLNIYIQFQIYYFNYIYIYIYISIYRDFHIAQKLSRCREQEGSATLVIVTMHLLSTLCQYKVNDIPLMISFFLLPSIWCRPVLSRSPVPHCQTPHSCSSFSSSSVTTVLAFWRTKKRVKKENCAM